MRITVKGKPYNLSFRHEAGPPSRLADLLTYAAGHATAMRVAANAAVKQALDALAEAQLAGRTAGVDPLRKAIDRACLDVRRLPTPEMAIQRVLDRVDKNLNMVQIIKTYDKDGNFLRRGLGRSARRPYLKRTLCTIWRPEMVEREGAVETRRPNFENPNADQIIATGETKCSDLDVYIREEGRAIALARAVCSSMTGFDKDALVSIGIQAFPVRVSARRGRQAYWKECAELRPELWPGA